MTLGDKIRKFRTLHGLKQKELGEKVGFKKSTADVRINQYESNKMAPKIDIRTSIADALDIDLAAISDVNIATYEELIHVFFELEENFGMNVVKENGKTSLVFDDNNEEITTLISYLNIWQNKKNSYPTLSDEMTGEQTHDYLLWKSRFKKNIAEYYRGKLNDIDNIYNPLVDNLKDTPHLEKTSDLTRLLNKIMDTGIQVSTARKKLGQGLAAQGFTFVVNELLAERNENTKLLFAQFLYEYYYYAERGLNCFTELNMIDKALTITYFIPISSFSLVTMQVNKYKEFLQSADSHSDYVVDSFNKLYEDDLETFYNYIEGEIEQYLV